MADLEEFKKISSKQEEEDGKKNAAGDGTVREDLWKEVDIIEEIMADQTKFSAYVSTVLEEEEK